MTETETDLVQRLREAVSEDHTRGCQGRQYSCSCGRDISLDVLLRAAAAEIERLRGVAQGAWMLIDTAPKDGTPLLFCYWDNNAQSDLPIVAGFWSRLSDQWVSDLTGRKVKPTHWMPRPVPPSSLHSSTHQQCGGGK